MSGIGRANGGGPNGRPIWADVEAAVEAALSRTTPKGRASIGRVFEAIAALRAAGAPISIEGVGGLCVGRHTGPTAQSIRNNERLADIVRIAAAVGAADALPRTGRPMEDEILKHIGNPELRTDAERLLAHRRSLIADNATLRSAVKRIEALSFLTREMAEAKIETLEELAASIRAGRSEGGGPAFEAEEILACRMMLDHGMAEAGLVIHEASGEIVGRHGRTVAQRGVAAALSKVAGSKPC